MTVERKINVAYQGRVVSDKMDKTLGSRNRKPLQTSPTYGKRVKYTKNL